MNVTIRHAARLAATLVGLGLVGAGCLTRPVEHADPTTKTNVQISVPNQVISKVDMLFDIDNSASMGDKQAYLQLAIPDLIDRLVNPNCVDMATPPNVVAKSMAGAGCPAGSTPEFKAVHDMHLGVVTSSLGSRLSDNPAPNPSFITLCPAGSAVATKEYTNLQTHNDDRGELISRGPLTLTPTTGTEGTVADAASGFLYWYPTTNTNPSTPPAIPVTAAATLEADFTSLVSGAGIFGCGIESQLESWYRFLVQPDPYDSLTVTNGLAQWVGVDKTIIVQRHDFLRPDSLVAIVVLSDENDSEIDVRSLGGHGYFFMHDDFLPPHGTSPCANNPADPNCVSCPSPSNDPACAAAYSASNDWGYDPNLRHVRMKAKYGLDPQFPIGRYYLGLTSTVIPDRVGEYPTGALNYVGNPDCVNPLFAAALPDGTGNLNDPNYLCTLTPGPRANQKSLVFYAHIGGVPNQLLHFDPNNLQASALSQADWVKILGNGPANYTVGGDVSYDYTGIDPHMIESYTPRTAATPNFPAIASDSSGTNPLAPTNAPSNTDPVNGREWITDQPAPAVVGGVTVSPHVLPVDREYACTFPLVNPTTGAATPRDCTQDYNANSCDCPAMATGLTHDQTPSVCDDTNPTSQLFAKAYPTIRELQLAKLMGPQGIVASLCPIHPADQGTPTQPDGLFGYRPAVAVIVDRLKTALTNACLPEKLSTTGDAGSVPCLILVTLPFAAGSPGTCKNPVCDPKQGLFGPGAATGSAANAPLDQAVLDKFCDAQEATYTQGSGKAGAVGDPANQSVCQLVQLTTNDPNAGAEFAAGSCSNSMAPGWCYVSGAAANGCAQAVQFATNSPPPGSVTNLQCIEESISVVSGTQ